MSLSSLTGHHIGHTCLVFWHLSQRESGCNLTHIHTDTHYWVLVCKKQFQINALCWLIHISRVRDRLTILALLDDVAANADKRSQQQSPTNKHKTRTSQTLVCFPSSPVKTVFSLHRMLLLERFSFGNVCSFISSGCWHTSTQHLSWTDQQLQRGPPVLSSHAASLIKAW